MKFLLAKEKNELKGKIDSLETIFKKNKISEQEFKDLKFKIVLHLISSFNQENYEN